MKKNILLSGLVALLAIFSGCEMNEEPKSEASVDMVFRFEDVCIFVLQCLTFPGKCFPA